MDYIKALEKEITDHFEKKVKEFQKRNSGMTFNEALSTWADRYSAIYNTPSYVNEFVESSLRPKFGITYSTLQESLRSEGTTFMNYVESLLSSRLTEGGIFNKEDDSEDEARELKIKTIEDSIDAEEGSLDDLNDEAVDNLLGNLNLENADIEEDDESDSDDPEEKANKKKASIIKKITNDDSLDLSDADGEELDNLLGKLSGATNIAEKVIAIRNAFKERNTSIIEKAIAKGTGMTLEESKMVLEMLDE